MCTRFPSRSHRTKALPANPTRDEQKLEAEPVVLEPQEQVRAEDDRERPEAEHIGLAARPRQQHVERIREQQLGHDQRREVVDRAPVPAPVRVDGEVAEALDVVLGPRRRQNQRRPPALSAVAATAKRTRPTAAPRRPRTSGSAPHLPGLVATGSSPAVPRSAPAAARRLSSPGAESDEGSVGWGFPWRRCCRRAGGIEGLKADQGLVHHRNGPRNRRSIGLLTGNHPAQHPWPIRSAVFARTQGSQGGHDDVDPDAGCPTR